MLLTVDMLNDICGRLASADEGVRKRADLELAEYAGTGLPPADQTYFQSEYEWVDYICTLADGRFVVWGDIYLIKPGVVGRQVMVVDAYR